MFFGSIYPPHNQPPLITKKTFGGKICVTINSDGGTITPLINDDVWTNLPRILKIGGLVVDRKSIDLWTTSIRKASEIWVLLKFSSNWWFCGWPQTHRLIIKLAVLLLIVKASIYEQNLYEKLQKCDWQRGKGISMRLWYIYIYIYRERER